MICSQRQMEEIREARKQEAEARQEERKSKLVRYSPVICLAKAYTDKNNRRTLKTPCGRSESGRLTLSMSPPILLLRQKPRRPGRSEWHLLDVMIKWQSR